MRGAAAIAAPKVSIFNPWDAAYPTPLHAVYASDPLWTPPADGAAVTTLRNQSGGGDPTQATAAARALFRNSGIGGRPAWQFDGNDDFFDVDIADVNNPFKVLAVVKATTNANARRFIGQGGTNTRGIGQNGTPTWEHGWSANQVSGTAADLNAHVFRVTVSPTVAQMWLDETSIVGPGNAGTGNLVRFCVGAGFNGTAAASFFGGYISYLGVYASATPDADLTTLARAIGPYHGITVA